MPRIDCSLPSAARQMIALVSYASFYKGSELCSGQEVLINMCSLQQTPYFFHGNFPNFIEQKTKKMRFWSKIKI